MADAIRTYTTKVTGLWSPRHEFFEGDERLGVLSIKRNGWGMVVSGEYKPDKGEELHFRRDPGLLRAQFSLWTDSREWLGSSMRWHVARRQIDLWTAGKPFRLVPAGGFRRGWRMLGAKTGESLSIEYGLLGRNATIQLRRKTDLDLVLFCYFLGSMTLGESRWPSSLHERLTAGVRSPAASKA